MCQARARFPHPSAGTHLEAMPLLGSVLPTVITSCFHFNALASVRACFVSWDMVSS